MDENDTILIQELADSFRRQLQWYSELRDLVRKILSRLVLSRGDITGVIAGLEKKKDLLENIQNERSRTSAMVEKWQSRKGLMKNGETQALDEVLEQTGTAIREFLDEEEQLKKYIESIVSKQDGGAAG